MSPDQQATETLFDRLMDSYVAYLPWLGMAIGFVMLVLSGTAAKRPSRRFQIIGLLLVAISATAILVQLVM